MGVEAGRLAFAGEWDPAGQQFEEQAAERVDVDPGVDRAAGDLLGGDVVEGADEAPGLGQARLGGDVAGDAEVRDVGVLFALLAAEQDVGGLDVAVDQAGGVDRVEAVADLGDQRHRVGGVEPAVAVDPAAEVRAGNEAHRDVGHAPLLAGRVDRDHIGVLDRGGDPRLLGEALGEDLLGGRLGSDQLQRHAAIEARLERQIEDSHAAAAEPALDPVAGKIIAF